MKPILSLSLFSSVLCLICLSFQVGNHIDVQSQKWVAQDAGIGAGVDSYFEYLVKGAIMLQDEELLNMFLGNTHVFLSHAHNLTLGKGLERMF